MQNDDSKFSQYSSKYYANAFQTSIQFQFIQINQSSMHVASNSLFDEFIVLRNIISMHNQFVQTSFNRFDQIDRFAFINHDQKNQTHQIALMNINQKSLKQFIEIKFVQQNQKIIRLKQKMKIQLNDINENLKFLIK